eukprot:CAMPEP_0194085068 /NCGR_PEP_ID=MMETSP0149-20130528/16204_1 /TAXON_ID=122233 /ORGANISM="Chaetoceros debilis, Strain MM31A-1" /LENGTH=889 /DNA_ID=CAMNT_0038767871 /DNA_START=1 /DNA_END=2670 /DNA_ORIENTATION=-
MKFSIAAPAVATMFMLGQSMVSSAPLQTADFVESFMQHHHDDVVKSIRSFNSKPEFSYFNNRVLTSGSDCNKNNGIAEYTRTNTNSHYHGRHLRLYPRREDEDDKNQSKECDVQFMACIQSDSCTQCFADMTEKKVDWSIIAPNTPCDNVLNALTNQGICTGLIKPEAAVDHDTFCKTFDSCIIWNEGDNDDEEQDDKKEEDKIDCDALTSCDFDGYKESYIGDGICNEPLRGCYNHKICNYDGGDCCEDTCKTLQGARIGCGSDGFFCRDPEQTKCETAQCKKDRGEDVPNDNDKPISPKSANCTEEETPYRLFQYDSFGDGWDVTHMKITENSGKAGGFDKLIYAGGLQDGSEGMEYICLNKSPTCYNTYVEGGFWGNEISWEIKPLKTGSRAISSGSSPMDCDFPVSGDDCKLTCDGIPNRNPEDDKKYRGYHQMVNCINEKCLIQLETCAKDSVCSSCIVSDPPPSYCLALDLYNALVFCTECNCVPDIDQEEKKKFCNEKSRDPHENDGDGADNDDGTSGQAETCSFQDFLDGTDALIDYGMCSGIDATYALVTEFDNENFGMIDEFEKCATAYHENKYSNNALDCMRILQNAIDKPVKDPNRKDVPTSAISALARDLMKNGEAFCDCSAKASHTAPACKDFTRFKTLLYESLDGCRALDQIDCPAWGEFFKPCKENLEEKFGISFDLREKKTCDYIHDGCGDVGPFPSFRKLDCEDEGVSHEAWEFYLEYEKECLRDGPVTPSGPKPSPTPPAPSPRSKYTSSPTEAKPSKPTKAPKPSPSKPSTNSSDKKKYVSPEERNRKGGKGFRNFIIVCLIGGGAYFYYKKRGGFNYAQFRRARNHFSNDESGMYDSLNLETSVMEPSFQPPTLPPGPSAYGNPNQYS